jgi:hypothetical protein
MEESEVLDGFDADSRLELSTDSPIEPAIPPDSPALLLWDAKKVVMSSLGCNSPRYPPTPRPKCPQFLHAIALG